MANVPKQLELSSKAYFFGLTTILCIAIALDLLFWGYSSQGILDLRVKARVTAGASKPATVWFVDEGLDEARTTSRDGGAFPIVRITSSGAGTFDFRYTYAWPRRAIGAHPTGRFAIFVSDAKSAPARRSYAVDDLPREGNARVVDLGTIELEPAALAGPSGPR